MVEKKEHTLLQKFRFTKRFVDDLLALNNDVFDDYLYCTQAKEGVRGIYPGFLDLAIEQNSTQTASFLDTQTVFDDIRWYTKIYDKREHPPLSDIEQRKYPHPSSFLSVRAMYGVITSRLHCFSRICTRRVDFIERACLFLREFLARGHSRSKTSQFVARFLKTTPTSFHISNIRTFVNALMKGC